MNQARPNVLFVSRELSRNGIGSHLETLSRRFLERGWGVGLAYDEVYEDGDTWAHDTDVHLKQVTLPSFKNGVVSTSMKAVAGAGHIAKAAADLDADVIHVHGMAAAPFAYLGGRPRRLPVITTAHLTPNTARSRTLRKAAPALKHGSRLLGHRQIAISREIEQTMRELWRVPAQQISRIPNGVDARHFRPPSDEERSRARASYGLDATDHVVAIVGRLYERKGHHVLLDAAAKLRSEAAPIHILCAGTGPQERRIREQAQELGISDRVHMLGFVDARDVLWASDVLALPSRREGCPLVIPEAMLSRVIPVRTPAAGAGDQIDDGKDGFLVPFGDSETLADRLRTLFDEPARRKKMAREAESKARAKFTAECMVDRTEQVYRSAMSSAPSHPIAARARRFFNGHPLWI